MPAPLAASGGPEALAPAPAFSPPDSVGVRLERAGLSVRLGEA